MSVETIEAIFSITADFMCTQCDADGNEYLLYDLLIDYCKNSMGISLTDQKTDIHGRLVTHQSTAGWQICCQWEDSSTSWEKLSDLKKSHPIQTVEFAVNQRIDHEPALK